MTAARNFWMGAALAAAIVAAPARAARERDVAQRVAAEADGQVIVNNIVGSVNVEGWDKAEVDVAGTVGAGVERLDVLRDGKRVTVKVVLPKTDRHNDADAALTIRVPKGSSLEVTTVSADTEVRGVAGPLRLKSVSGEIVARDAAKDCEIKTVSGDIRASAANSPAKMIVYSVSGNVVVDDLAGEIEATTVSGDMTLDLGTLTGVRLRTTSGDTRLGGRLAKGARVDYESVSGDLSAALASEAGFAAEVDTFSGSLSNCFGVRPEAVGKYGPGERMSLTRGAGGAQVRARTMSGDVGICDR